MAAPEGELPTDLPSDADEDEELRYAIALSLREENLPGSNSKPHDDSQGAQASTEQSKSSAFGSMILDRKAMEQERLQRLAAKRGRPPPDEEDDVVEVPPPKKQAISTSRPPQTASTGPKKSSSAATFPDGAVKRTWARGYPRSDDDIKIEEVFQKDRLELAVLSSFQWDEEWLLSKLDIRRTKLLLVAFAADEAQKQQMRDNSPPNVKFCFPPMKGPGAMHSKLQLLKYPDSLRIVVPTGNLVPHDWGESGVLENMLFLIDLPRLADASDHKPTRFSEELGRFLRASQIDEKMISSLTNYDVSRTSRLELVYTIPGGHTDELRRRTGYCGLGDSVSALGLATHSPIQVDIVSASLGSLNYDFIGAIYNACQGDNGMKEYTARTSRKPATKPASSSPLLRERCRVYFPSNKTVAHSRGGVRAAGTICVQSKWWRSPSFPTELVRDCANNREGLLMHTKLILVRTRSEGSEHGATTSSRGGYATAGWAYVGSANLSESAWGRLVKDSKTGKPKMNCRNWECGVVIPMAPPSTSSGSGGITRGDDEKHDAAGGDNGKGKDKGGQGGAEMAAADHQTADASGGHTGNSASALQRLMLQQQEREQQQRQQQKRTKEMTTTTTIATTSPKGTDLDPSQKDLDAVFGGTIPIPMRLPGRLYNTGEEPWFFMERH